MMDSNRSDLPGPSLIIGAEVQDRRAVRATANIRRVGLTEHPDVIAARFYFERSEQLFRLIEPGSRAIEDLKGRLRIVAELQNGDLLSSLGESSPFSNLSDYVGDLIDKQMMTESATGSAFSEVGQKEKPHWRQDEVSDIWKSWQSLQHLTDFILSCGVLSLTPAARPLIQLSVELQDFLLGRRDGSLLRARRVVRASRRARDGEQRATGRSGSACSATDQLTPWQSLIASLAASTAKVDVQDDALWMEACSQALEAAILYLTEQGFSSRTLGPLSNLAQALRKELSGEASSLFDEPLHQHRHGLELSPSKPLRLHRLYFNLLLIKALKTFRDLRRSDHIKLRTKWLEEQLRLLLLRDKSGVVITLETVRRLDSGQVDSTNSDSESYRYRQAASVASGVFLSKVHLVGSVGRPVHVVLLDLKKERTFSAPPPELSVQTLLQAALLYEPRHLRRGTGKRASAEPR